MNSIVDSSVMNWSELRFIFARWPVEMVNQLYIEMIEDAENGFY